jgi:hypothetical protein
MIIIHCPNLSYAEHYGPREIDVQEVLLLMVELWRAMLTAGVGVDEIQETEGYQSRVVGVCDGGETCTDEVAKVLGDVLEAAEKLRQLPESVL